MRGQAFYSLMMMAVLVACPLVCPLNGMASRHVDGAVANDTAGIPVCPCCPRHVPRDTTPTDAPPVTPQAPGSDCLCKGAIGAAERAWSIDPADAVAAVFEATPTDVVAPASVAVETAAKDELAPLSGRERRILRASLRF
jgi:hypothetical protein